VAVIAAETSAVSADVPVGETPGPIVAGEGAIWVGNEKERTISRIDPDSRTVVRTIGVGFPISGLAVGQGSIWIASGREGLVHRLDPSTGSLVDTLRFRPPQVPSSGFVIRTNEPVAMVFGEGGLWIGDRASFTLLRIDPRTGRTTARVADVDAKALAFGAGSVWVVSYVDQEVVRVDSKTRAISARIPVPANPNGIVVGERAIWVAHDREGTVSQIDPFSAQVDRTIDRGATPVERAVSGYITAMAAEDGFVWVANSFDHTVSRIEEATLDASLVDVERNPAGLVTSGGDIWVTISSRNPL
jgi:streptogramin lyase